MNKTSIFSLVLMLATAFGIKAQTYEITAGELHNQLPADASGVVSLTLSGTMNAADFETIAELLPSLRVLNLSAVTIEELNSVRPLLGSGYTFRAGELPAGALFGKHLTSLELPANITVIGDQALADNDFAELEIPSTVTTIGNYAMYGCKELMSITIPSSVTSLGEYALAGCTGLQSVDLSAASIDALPQCLLSGDASLSSISFPSGLVSLGYGSLMGTSALKSVTLPGTLRTIGDRAFAYSGLESVTLPSSVKSVGEFAFAHCTSLSRVNCTAQNVELGQGTFFYDPALVSISLKGFTSMPDFVFTGGTSLNLQSVDMGSISRIGDYALKDNPSQSITLPCSVTEVGTHVMDGMTSLTELNVAALRENVPQTAEQAFEGINQGDVVLKVNEGTADVWNAADQWKEFRVVAVTSIAVVGNDSADSIHAWIKNGQLNIEAQDTIENVSVYDLDGTHVVSLQPGTFSVRQDISHLNSRVYIVNVKTSKAGRTFKLMR